MTQVRGLICPLYCSAMTLRKPVKIVLWVFGALAGGIVLLLLAIMVRWKRTFDAPYPELHASTDTAVIAYGRYLALGPAHCASCHAPWGDTASMRGGAYPPLAGG